MMNWEDEQVPVEWPGSVRDGSDFATDASAIPDLDLAMVKAGTANLGEALYRRLITPRGGLFYDPDYGFDVRQWINQHGTTDLIYELATGVALECEKDPRVLRAAADVVQLDQRTGAIIVTATLADVLTVFAFEWSPTGISWRIVQATPEPTWRFTG
jgi:hypothetical protein